MKMINGRAVEPDVRVIEVTAPASPASPERTHRVAFDCNAVHAWLLEPHDAPPDGSAVAPSCPVRGSRPRFMVLNLTHKCNLACEYCFVRKADPQPGLDMTYETAITAINLLPKDRPLHVAFFGGEPMLCWNRLVAIVEQVERIAQQRGTWPMFSLTTNGTLIGRDQAEFLHRHGFSYIVSIDGPQPVHDRQRPHKHGRESYAATMSGLEWLRAYGDSARVVLRGTYATEATAELADGWLTERVAWLNGLIDQGFADRVDVEPAWRSESCAGETCGGDPPHNLEAEYWMVARWYVARRRMNMKASFQPFDLLLKRLQAGRHHLTECGGGQGYVTCGPNGTLFACHREGDTKIGHVGTGIDEALTAQWLDNRWYTRDGCPSCWLRYLCGGGCRFNSIQWQGSIRTPAAWECWLRDVTARCALWILAELS